MFVRVKKIGPYEYLYLVENVREGGRHVQRVIKALGRRDAVENSDLLDGLIASAARHSRRSIVLSSFYRGELAELRRRSIGPDLVFGRLWVEIGCRDVLRRHLANRRFGFDVERTIYLTVLHRLMVSGSDRHASTWQHSVHIPGADALTLDHAYKAMAWLGEDIGARQASQTRCRTEVIEEALYNHRRSLFGALSVAFFDTTSLYFEGQGGATLGQRGYSKDFRPQLHQVVLGIVLDENDRPIASFLWPGNTADVTTLLPVVERLRSRFGVRRACVVADRGMISAATIAALEAQGIDYILGVRERTLREIRQTVLEDDGVAVPLIIPRQKGETDLAVKNVEVAGRRYVVCRNAEEARKDAETRTALIASLERKLAQGDKALVANTGYRQFLSAPAGLGFAIDPDKVAADAQFDGVRPANQHEIVSAGGGAALPKSAGGRAKLPGSKNAARHTTGVPPHRCRNPWPHRLHLPRPAVAQRVARSTGRSLRTDAGMAAHHRRSARSQCRRSRAGRPSCHPPDRTQAKHRSDLPRDRTHIATHLSGDADSPDNPRSRLTGVVPKKLMH
jgi:hypothetical protein